MSDFPNRLKELINEQKLTHQALADNIGVSRQIIPLWANGKTIPTIDNFKRIAEYFDVSYDYLYGDSENRKHENKILVDELGLHDGVIEMFRQIRAEGEQLFSKMGVLNNFLRSEYFSKFLEHTRNYFEGHAHFEEEMRQELEEPSSYYPEQPAVKYHDNCDFSRYLAVRAVEEYLEYTKEDY